MEGGFGWEPYWSLCSTDRSAAPLHLGYFAAAADTCYWDVFAVAFGADSFDIDESAVAFGAAAELVLDYFAADTFDIDALDTFVAAAFEIDAFAAAAAFGIEVAAAEFAVDAAAAEFAAFAAAFAAAALPGQCLLGVFGCPNCHGKREKHLKCCFQV